MVIVKDEVLPVPELNRQEKTMVRFLERELDRLASSYLPGQKRDIMVMTERGWLTERVEYVLREKYNQAGWNFESSEPLGFVRIS